MALNFQKIDLNLRGLDEKTDDKQLEIGKFTELKNLWIDKTGEFQKRYGLANVSTSQTLSDPLYIADWFGKPVIFNDSGYTYVSSDGNSTTTDEKWIYGNYEFSNWSGQLGQSEYIDYAECSDYGVGGRLVEVDLAGSVTVTKLELSFYDNVSKRAFYKEQITTTQYKIIAATDRVFVFWVNGDEIEMDVFSGFDGSGNPSSTNTTIQATDSGLNIGMMDAAIAQGGNIVALFTSYQSTATTGRARIYSYNYSTSSLTTVDTSVGTKPTLIAIGERTNSEMNIAYFDSGLTYTVKYEKLTFPNTLSGPTSVATFAGETVDQLSTTYKSNDFIFVHRLNALTTPGGEVVEIYKLSGTWAVDKQLGNCRLASRAFSHVNGCGSNLLYFYIAKDFVDADRTNNGIACCYYENDYKIAVETLLPGTGKSLWSGSIPPPSVTDINFESYTTCFVVSAGTEDTAKIATRKYETNATFGYWKNTLLHNITPNLMSFDGLKNNIVGWNIYPAQTLSIASAGAGSAYAAGDYGVVACYERYDSQGNISRSAPSIVKSATLVASSGVDVELEPYPFFDKENDIDNVWLAIYRTEVDGSLYYLDGRIKLYDQSFTSGYYDRLDYSFQESDTDLISKPLLYTTGGIIEHIGPPSCKAFTVSKDRCWVVSAEDGRPWYSKSRLNLELPNFSDAFVLEYEGNAGLTALSPMDDKTILFGDDTIFAVYGVGPDETGNGNYEVQERATDLGTIQPKSLVYSLEGIYFMSYEGLQLLTPDLNVSWIGSAIVDQKSATIVNAFELKDRQQIWFCGDDGVTQVYDTYHRIWSNYESDFDTFFHASNVGLVPYFLAKKGVGNSLLVKESTSVYQDNSEDYECRMVSGWINLAGIQGYVKLKEFGILGEATSTAGNQLIFKIYNDFDDTLVETFTATTSVVGYSDRYQWGFKPKVRRLESFKFELSFTTSDSGFKISSVSLMAGMLPKIYKQKITRRVEGT